MPYIFLYAAVVISVQVVGVPVSISDHDIIITLPTLLVNTTPVTSSITPSPVTSCGLPADDVALTPVTEYIDSGTIEPTALVEETPVTATDPVIENVTEPTDEFKVPLVTGTSILGATITEPTPVVVDTPVTVVPKVISTDELPTELVSPNPDRDWETMVL